MTTLQYLIAVGSIVGVAVVVALLIVVAFNGMSSPLRVGGRRMSEQTRTRVFLSGVISGAFLFLGGAVGAQVFVVPPSFGQYFWSALTGVGVYRVVEAVREHLRSPS